MTFKAGSDSDSLTLSGGTASVTLDVGTIYNGQTLQIYRSDDRQVTFTLIGTCTVSSGECTFSTNKFSDFTLLQQVDEVPDAFTFNAVSSVALESTNTSNTVTITGMNTATGATTTAGTLIIDGTPVGSTGTVGSGDTVAVSLMASASYGTAVSATVTIGGVSSTYTVTTLSAPSNGGGGGG